MLKTSGFALGFQYLPRDLANVNEWKIMFGPYIEKRHGYVISYAIILFLMVLQKRNFNHVQIDSNTCEGLIS